MEVIYLAPVYDTPVGGVRMFYIHAEQLNKLGVSGFVYHPQKPDYLCDWFEHGLKPRTAEFFKQSTDILVVPEMWAISYGVHCMESEMRYAVFVQNGYLIDQGLKLGMEQKLREVYRKASLILTISEQVESLLRLAFPELDPSKFFRCVPYISPEFVPRLKKKTITYMPRKLPRQSEMVCFFLKQYLPPDWCLEPIENVTDTEVRERLGDSSVFMSFSEFEGLAAPPIEAAFAGNAVVGYSGGGGNEYFEKPIFTKIENGDVHRFVKEVLVAIENSESFGHSEEAARQRRNLVEHYGEAALHKNIEKLAVALRATF